MHLLIINLEERNNKTNKQKKNTNWIKGFAILIKEILGILQKKKKKPNIKKKY